MITEVAEELALRRSRLELQAGVPAPMVLQACAWGSDELELFDTLFNHSDYHYPEILRRRQAVESQDPPDASLLCRMRREKIYKKPRCPEPQWLRDVANNREHFKNTAFIFDVGNGGKAAAQFLFAFQAPYPYAAFSVLRWVERPGIGGVLHDGNLDERSDLSRQIFAADFSSFLESAELADFEIDNVAVLDHLRYESGRELKTWAVAPQPLKEFLAMLPPKRQPERGARDGASASGSRRTQGKGTSPAWVTERFKRRAVEHELPIQMEVEPRDVDEYESQELQTAEEVEAFLSSLELRRAEYAAAGHDTHTDFKVIIQKNNEQRATNAVQYYKGIACNDFARDWCRLHGLQQSQEFTVGKYEEQACGILARSFCHRMQFFFDLVYVHDNTYVPNSADKAAYVEPTELGTLLGNPDIPQRVRDRARRIRAIFAARP